MKNGGSYLGHGRSTRRHPSLMIYYFNYLMLKIPSKKINEYIAVN